MNDCRIMETRQCPLVYDGPCGSLPCARFESDDETIWAPEVRRFGKALGLLED